MRVQFFAATAGPVVVCLLFGCSGPVVYNANGDDASAGGDDAGAGDDATETGSPDSGARSDAHAAADTGAPSTVYPAFAPAMGQIQKNGSGYLTAPVIVTITWADDDPTSVSAFEQFGDDIGGSSYWTAATSEYGIGTAQSGTGNHIHIAANGPMQMNDSDIQTFVQQNVGAALPAPTAQTIYALYLSPSTQLIYNGSPACTSGIGGYHSITTASGFNPAYAVIPRCGGGGAQGIQSATLTASHELVEAASDSPPGYGYTGFETPYMAWEYFLGFQHEIGDACEFYQDSFFMESAPFAFAVQRIWSNKSGAAGHAPCVPAPAGSYFNVTPLNPQTIDVDLTQQEGSPRFATKGYAAKVGQTVTFQVGFYSDGPTSGPWQLSAHSGNPLTGLTSNLVATVDSSKMTGVNGETTSVTVKVVSAGASKGEVLTLSSYLGGTTHYMPVLIGSL